MKTDSSSLSNHHCFGFIVEDRYLQKTFHRANPNGPCYCTSPNQDKKQIENMVSEFKSYGMKETLRKYAVEIPLAYIEIIASFASI